MADFTPTTDNKDDYEAHSFDQGVHLSDAEIQIASDAIRDQDSDTVRNILHHLSSADIAELIAKLNEENRETLLSDYGEHIDGHAFLEMDYELRRKALESMPVAQIAALIVDLESDDALDLIVDLDENLQKSIIHKLSAKMRLTLEEGLSFPEDSAGRLMQREFVAVPQFWTVGKTIDYLREAADDLPEDFFDIFVISPAYHIIGQIPANRILRARRGEKIENLVSGESRAIPATMDQEDVAHLFRRDNIASAPVIDESGRLIGVITHDDIVDVIDEEAQEDILRLSGVEQHDFYQAAIKTSGTRFRWLFVNLLTAILASGVVALFDATIDQIVALAVLMPIVASMGGNAGTQALAVVTRALATRQLSSSNSWGIIWKETLVGSINGVLFALLTGLITMIWFQNPMLGGVIALAMCINMLVAGFFGAGIPILLSRLGSDPAVSSTVLLTTLTDVIGFFAFLGLAAILLL